MGEGKDLTQGNLLSNMIRFCIPLLFTNLLNSMYNIVDGIWIGNLVGDNGVATVTNCYPIILVASSILAGVTITTSVMISQQYASSNREKIKNIITPIYVISIVLGIITALTLIFTTDMWFNIFNTPQEILKMSKEYITFYMIGYIFNFFGMTIIEGIRATGNSKAPLALLTTSMILNVILDPIFILAGFGVAGAAIATAVSMLVGLVINLIYVKKKSDLLCFDKKYIKFEKDFLYRVINIGLPVVIQELSTIVTIMLEVNVSNSLGVIGSSAYGVVSKLQQIIWIIGGSVKTLLTVVVGQFVGKRLIDDLENVMKNALKIVFVPTVLIALFIIFGSKPFCLIFTDNPEVIEAAIKFLSVGGISFVLSPLCQVLFGFILGTGNTKYTFFTYLVSSVVEVVTILVLQRMYDAPLIILGIGILFWYITEIALCGIYYLSKRWKKIECNA